MSDEFKNINDTGSEPEKGMEHSNDGSYTQGDSFVMRSSEENEKKSRRVPGDLPGTSGGPQRGESLLCPYLPESFRTKAGKRHRLYRKVYSRS